MSQLNFRCSCMCTCIDVDCDVHRSMVVDKEWIVESMYLGCCMSHHDRVIRVFGSAKSLVHAEIC